MQEQPSVSLPDTQAEPVVCEPSFKLLQPLSGVQQSLQTDTAADTGEHSCDRSGQDTIGDSDMHNDVTSASLLHKSMMQSMSQLAEASEPQHGTTSDRTSSHSRRSSIVPADDMLPHMPARPAQLAASRCGIASAVLGLLKEESDVFEDDAPLNFLKPAAMASPQLHSTICLEHRRCSMHPHASSISELSRGRSVRRSCDCSHCEDTGLGWV